MIFWDDVVDLSLFSTPFPGCLCRVPRRRYSHSKLPLSCEVVENRSTVFGPHFTGRRTQKFLRRLVTKVYPLPCGKSLVEFCGLKCVREARQWKKRRIFGGWMKTTVLFLAVNRPKFVKFWDDGNRKLQRVPYVSDSVSRLSISCFAPEILALKFVIKLRSCRN